MGTPEQLLFKAINGMCYEDSIVEGVKAAVEGIKAAAEAGVSLNEARDAKTGLRALHLALHVLNKSSRSVVDESLLGLITAMAQAGADMNLQHSILDNDDKCSEFKLRYLIGPPIIRFARQFRGHSKSLHALLDLGADVTLEGPGGLSIVSALLWHDTRVNSVEEKLYESEGLASPRLALDVLQRVIAGGADVKPSDVHLAAATGSREAVEMLLDHRSDPSDLSSIHEGRPLLHSAASPAVLQLLIEKGASIHDRDLGGRTPLHWALERRSWSIALSLVEARADVNAKDGRGMTALHHALAQPGVYARCPLQVISALLERGASVHVRDHAGRLPLTCTLLPSACWPLLNAGADQADLPQVDFRGMEGGKEMYWLKDLYTSMWMEGHHDATRDLVRRMALPEGKDDFMLALLKALDRKLLDDVSNDDSSGCAAGFVAMLFEVLQPDVRRRIEVNSLEGRRHETLLWVLVGNSLWPRNILTSVMSVEIVRCCLLRGAHFFEGPESMHGLLGTAFTSGKSKAAFEMAKLLMQYGADPCKAKDSIPSWIWGDMEAAELLLVKHKVPVPMNAGAPFAPLDVVKLLLDKGADPCEAAKACAAVMLENDQHSHAQTTLEYLFFEAGVLSRTFPKRSEDRCYLQIFHRMFTSEREAKAERQRIHAMCDAVKDIPALELPSDLTVEDTFDAIVHHPCRLSIQEMLQNSQAQGSQD